MDLVAVVRAVAVEVAMGIAAEMGIVMAGAMADNAAAFRFQSLIRR